MDAHRNSSPGQNIDRFIPNRSAMDLGFAHCMLTQSNKGEPDFDSSWLRNSKARQTYKEQLAEALGVNRTRILAFNSNPSTSNHPPQCQSSEPLRNIPQKPHKMLKAPFTPDVYLNILDWSSRNILCFAVEDLVYTWNPVDNSISIVAKFNLAECGPVSSVSWSPNGRQLAIGLFNSHVQIWDTTTSKLLRMFIRGHRCQVGALAWNNDHNLTTGGVDNQIINHDIRIPSHIVGTYSGHFREVCGLKWSESGQRLASGGKDGLVHIWDRSMASSTNNDNNNNNTQWLHRFAGHRGSVKALAWCPFRVNLLASGGHDDDKCIKLWDIRSGACVKSANTGSQVSGLLWNKEESELLSSHGVPYNNLILWKFPSMEKMAKLSSHTGSVISMADSPNGYSVASAATDDTMRIWDVFGDSKIAKPAAKPSSELFSCANLIR